MNLTVTGHHVDVTPAIREYVAQKVGRIRRHFDRVIDVNVTLSVEKLRQMAEASVRIRGRSIVVQSEDADMYAAIDRLIDKLDRQILRHKSKRSEKRPNGAVRPQASE